MNKGLSATMFWVIMGRDEAGGQPKPLTVDVPRKGRALAAFSFEEEARLHLWLGAPTGRWAVEEAAPEELVRMLSGPLCSVGWVALDPMAEAADSRVAVGLVSMNREDFLGLLSSSVRAMPRRPAASVEEANAGSGIASERRREAVIAKPEKSRLWRSCSTRRKSR